MVDVILHLGAHRTGTTTFQRFLAANRAKLASSGLVVWGPERTRDGLFSGLLKAPHRVTSDVQRRGARSCGVIRVELERLAIDGARHLIVSEENMLGTMESNFHTRRLYPQAAARMARFADGFAGQSLHVALGIRRYDRYWASALSYLVKSGHGLPGQDVLDTLATQPRHWMRVIRDLAEVFPAARLTVWPMERMVNLPDHLLAGLTGRADWPALHARREWHNASPTCAVLHQVLRDQGDPPEVLARMPITYDRWTPFSEAQIALMTSDYSKDLAWLRAGADGLATFIDSPNQIPGATRHGEGRQNDQRIGGVG